ncbi:MAG: hypothetical protein A3H91_09675 [Gammaproteobacteria bacterium RIFCSPLOWO2_02_FULL_61_13]|nr:MAG: hypothetical protein A3H91_09675 [Gammaproteobacteria bacterium RIFCSPLOWO2_02_FULL_61_13]
MFDVIVNDSDGNRVKTFRCPVAECSIGKARDNFIQLKGWRVAGHHAEIRRTPEGLFVEDKTGQARIEVNGVEVEHFGPLKSTDVIHIAGYQISAGMIQDAGAKPSGAKPATAAGNDDDDDDDSLKTAIGVSRHAAIEESDALSKTIVSLMHNEKYKWRNRVHDELLEMMDLRRTDIGSMDEGALRAQVQEMVREIIKKMGDKLPSDLDREALATEVLNEAVGLGPLEKLLADDSITEIMVNKFDDIYVEKAGKLTKSDVTFSSDNAVMTAIERIVSPLGRRIDESSPMVDARLKDGSRVNAIIPPLALRGPCLTIRKFAKSKLQAEDLIRFGAINEAMVQFLQMAVKHKRNVIISGGTGSGKTTTLNVLSNFIPPNERIVTVEDAAELKLAQPHLVSLEARPANLEGKGAVPIRDLVKNCLRMRPDRIVVGECRGGETLDMLQAMNTGHDGSLTTAHANTPRDLIARLEVMVMMSGMDLPLMAIREQVASAIHIIVQQTRFTDGSRRIIFITEITGVESGIVQLQDIFKYQQEGFDEKGRVTGHFMATGAVPEFYEDLRQRGLNVDMSIFKQ